MNKQLMNKILYNLIVASVIAIIFITIEQIFRVYSDSLSFNLKFKLFIEYLAINFLIISLKSKKAIKIIYSILIMFIFLQYLHMNFYGSWIFPLEYILFFQEFSEVIQTFSSVMHITVMPIILATILIVSTFFITEKLKENRLQIPYLNIILVAYLFFLPISTWVKDSNKGNKPRMERNTIRNTIWTISYLTGRIMPKKIFGNNSLEQKVIPTPKILQNNPQVNIIVVMGESLASEKMSLFGYKKQTTPFLEKLKDSKNFIYQQALTSGSMTGVAVPSFINILYKPDSMLQILSKNTCMFKMAKENGFNTYYYSTQSRKTLSGIKSFLCTNYIDEIKDGTDITGDEKKSALDGHLLNYLNNINLSKSNFIVLHQRGSHSPITGQYPKEFEKYKQKKDNTAWENYLLKYENSVLYTDYLLWNIIKTVKEKSKLKTYVIFTSDHGESVGYPNASGHGNLSRKEQYIIPFIMYAHNDEKIQEKIKIQKYISHYEMGLIIGNLMGYDFKQLCFNKDDAYVCGQDIRGFGGFLKVDRKNNDINTTFINF